MKKDPLVEAAMVTLDRLANSYGPEVVRRNFPELVKAVAKSAEVPRVSNVPYSGTKIGFLAAVAA